jgi:hypothetical protein
MKKHRRLIAALMAAKENGIKEVAQKWAESMTKSQQDWEHGYLAGTAECQSYWIKEIPENYPDELVYTPFSRWDGRKFISTGINAEFRDTSESYRAGYIAALKQYMADETAKHLCYLEIARLGHWIGLAKEVALYLWANNQDFTEVRKLKTEFIRWDVGGTYRHQVLLVGAHICTSHHGHYRPGIVGYLFGRGSSSKSGVVDTLEGILVYQDQ